MGELNSTYIKRTIYMLAIGMVLGFIPVVIQKVQVSIINHQINSLEAQLVLDQGIISGANALITSTIASSAETSARVTELETKLYTYNPRVSNVEKVLAAAVEKPKTTHDTKLDNGFYMYLDWMIGTAYKWWQKFWDKIDCSGLFSRYAYEQWYITAKQARDSMSARHIYELWQPKDLAHVERGDLIYFQKSWNHNYIAHIAVVLEVSDSWGIKILDAHPTHGTSRRWLNPTDWGIEWADGKRYNIVATTNFIRHMEVKYIYQWDFSVTSYIPTTEGMNINNWGKSGNHTATGLPLKDEYAGKIAACPKKYNIWLDGKSYDKLYIEWYGVVECRDRGWLITMAWELNSRWNIAEFNHLDIFMWLDTPKLERSKSDRRVYLIK